MPTGGPDPDPDLIAAASVRLRGLAEQYAVGEGDGDGRAGGGRGEGDPDPEPGAAAPGRLRGLPGQFVKGEGDGGVGGERGAEADVRGRGGTRVHGDGGLKGQLVTGEGDDVGGDWSLATRRKKRIGPGNSPVRVSHAEITNFVTKVNKFCWQKPGGLAQAPVVNMASEFGCFLCGSGLATCLGNSCKGVKTKIDADTPPRQTSIRSPQSPPTIPGLVMSTRYVLSLNEKKPKCILLIF